MLRSRSGAIGLVLLFPLLVPAQSDTWSGPSRPRLVGTAAVVDGRLRLTPAMPGRVGAAWFPEKASVAAGFEAAFQFQISDRGGAGGGADGFALVLQNQGPAAAGGRGAGGGFFLDGFGDPSRPGIPNSVAVFFDTYRNGELADPSDNYIAICTNSSVSKMRWPPSRLAVGRKLKSKLKDGRVHQAIVRYTPPVITVSLDGEAPVVHAPVDLRTVVDEYGRTYIGFTASTGSGYENHDILSWSFTTTDLSSAMVQSDITYIETNCLEGRNLCTPPEAVVRETAFGKYHVILPAHLPWGAGIPNPDGRSVAISNARGSVCWDADAPDGCSGPQGTTRAGSAAQALLVPGANPGALVSRNEGGRTLFSVNLVKASKPGAQQGYFEFDVAVE